MDRIKKIDNHGQATFQWFPALQCTTRIITFLDDFIQATFKAFFVNCRLWYPELPFFIFPVAKYTHVQPSNDHIDVTVESFAERCVRETDFECKYFDIDNKVQGCRLYKNSHDDPFIHLISSTYVDHYRSKYASSANILPSFYILLSSIDQ